MDDGRKAETLPTGEIESIRPKSGLVERQCEKGEKMFARNAVFAATLANPKSNNEYCFVLTLHLKLGA
jgi:hypothetical protein